ncbi:ABC-type oligopeptide transport system, periplasmic component [Solibacillus silvestris StLB046]|uniref:ABC-type oligopeptide transport system, periplasmic component n=1 Tax=Solibacillus silvestris (strain StLB046) TaxID=1002809 RepID=F2F8L0_SOLSS|nr:peptide ABC transporter substrate-binding protein [Solibacillus silvestris]OBW51640.1 ABC transporter substrate-binding protein [Solibacillus silvestris]BAK14951.1 ABC-type oligopeptide transport system, periplasmic component [Solibacillus silvestris StLB046]
MKRNKKVALTATALSLSALLAACGGDETKSTSTGDGEKELDLLITSEPPSLHPQLASDTTSGAILENTFEGLTTLVEGEPVLAAAEDYKVSDDLLTYTFTLRDAQWSNGEKVTAEDFEYAWKWALNPENASEYSTILYPIKGAEEYNNGKGTAEDVAIKAIDEKTLEVTLNAPTPYFLELTAFKTFYPIHKATAEADPKWYTEADTYVSNGAYNLSTWNHSGDIVLEKSDTYWDTENVDIDTVNIAMVESETTQMTMFDAGEIDFLGAPYGTISLDAIDRLKSEDKLNVSDMSSIYWYKFNTEDPVMQNENIRKALALAIDREGLISNVVKGEQEPALGIVPNSVEGFGEDEGYFKDADFEEAKKYLEAGLKELGLANPADLEVKVSYNTSEAHSAIAQFIQQGWSSNLGITVKLDNSEWQVYLDKIGNGDYQIGRLGWGADYNDAYTFLEMYNSAENGNNQTGWSNDEYTALLNESITETDPDKRTEKLLEAEAVIMEEMPVAPIYYNTNLNVVSDEVENMVPDALGNINLKYVKMK